MRRGNDGAARRAESDEHEIKDKRDGDASRSDLRSTPETETLHALLLLLLLLLKLLLLLLKLLLLLRCCRRNLMLRMMIYLRLHHALAGIVPKANKVLILFRVANRLQGFQCQRGRKLSSNVICMEEES